MANTYDALGRLLSRTAGGKMASYITYNPLGEASSMTDETGTTTMNITAWAS